MVDEFLGVAQLNVHVAVDALRSKGILLGYYCGLWDRPIPIVLSGGEGDAKTYDQSALVLGLSPLQADLNVLVDQFLEERSRVDGDEVHVVCVCI